MKKGDILEGVVEKVVFPNKGVVKTEAGNVIVKNTIPGQKIRLQVNKLRKGKGEGRLVELIEPSADETSTQCPHFGICGGCTYQTLPYEKQLEMKESQVRELVTPVYESYSNQFADGWFESISASPKQAEYRNKMEFSFGDEVKDGPLSLGMHKRGSFYDVVSVTGCRIVDEDYRMILTFMIDYFGNSELAFYHKMTHKGFLRHLLVRKAVKTGEILLDLVTTTQENVDLTPMVDGLLKLELAGKIIGILNTLNDREADVVQNDHTEILYGKDYFYEELHGLKFKITPFSFFQTNSLGAEVLYSVVRDYIGETKDKIIFDLYSGTGTIAQMLAPVAKQVIGVEIVEEAVEAAKENARLNGLHNCDFIAGDVLKVIDTLEEKPDLIVLDPPRDGIHPKAMPKILEFGVDRIVYISCKLTSLVRDLPYFLEAGYSVERVKPVDMFPSTANIETVVLLSQQKPDNHIEVDLDLDELDATSAETKATYNEIQQYVLKETGLMVSNLYIAQVKKKCGIEFDESFNKPNSENAKQPKCSVEKEKAIRDALEHFGMIQ